MSTNNLSSNWAPLNRWTTPTLLVRASSCKHFNSNDWFDHLVTLNTVVVITWKKLVTIPKFSTRYCEFQLCELTCEFHSNPILILAGKLEDPWCRHILPYLNSHSYTLHGLMRNVCIAYSVLLTLFLNVELSQDAEKIAQPECSHSCVCVCLPDKKCEWISQQLETNERKS